MDYRTAMRTRSTITFMKTPVKSNSSSALIGASLVGAAIGAAAVGFFAIGALAIGSLAVRKGRIDDLSIGNLRIGSLTVETHRRSKSFLGAGRQLMHDRRVTGRNPLARRGLVRL